MAENVRIKLLKKEELKKDILKFTCLAPEIAKSVRPGQFIEIRISKTLDPFLRRPISIYNVNEENGIIEFVFQVKGRGTELLSKVEEEDFFDVIGPLGDNGFDFMKYKSIAIIGGGIGIFPLYELAKRSIKQSSVYAYLGFRNEECVVLEEEFNKVSTKVIVTTDDGSYGQEGYAIDYLRTDLDNLKIDSIFACGPLPMLKKVKEFAESKNIACQLSLEERMACGVGACMGCSVKLNTNDGSIQYARVCKDGPVFEADKIDI